MSQTERELPMGARRAVMFAALGDETRLTLVTKLCDGQAYSITQLTAEQIGGEPALTRQAMTKHLRVLERARLVRCVRAGREHRFVLNPEPMDELWGYLQMVSWRWDEALGRLKDFVEE